MSKVLDEVLTANADYAANFGDKGQLPMLPGGHFSVLTCMGARLDPAKFAGISEGDAHVIRNAGGGTYDGKYINWLTISDNARSVVEDVQRIRNNSMVAADIPIYGYIYDCKTGKLIEVPEATEAGRAE